MLITSCAVLVVLIGAIALRQEKIMSRIEDLKTEVESFVSDVKKDVGGLKTKIDALDNANNDADLQALIDEVKAAHADLTATVSTAPSTSPKLPPTPPV